MRRCDVLVQNKTIYSLNLHLIEYFFKNGNLSTEIPFHVIRGRVVCIIVFIVSIWSDSCVFVDDLCQILECFHLIVLAM